MSRTKISESKSFESGSVTAEWSELNTVVCHLSSSGFTGSTNTDYYPADNATGNLSAEVITVLEERGPKNLTPMTVRFAEMQQIILIKGRPKGADHRKMGYRQIPNPWRRFGALKTLHDVGGWLPARAKNKKMQLIRPGTSLSSEPRGCHSALHQDRAILKQEFFKFKLNSNVDSQTVAYSVGHQISESCQSK